MREQTTPAGIGVSVVVTVLNDAAGTERLLEAVLGQSRPPDEVVVVDGGSRDGTEAVLARYAARDARLRALVHPGVNIARGRNLAIEAARGPIIATTDAGCRPEPGWLAALTAPFTGEAPVDVASGAVRIEARSDFEQYAGLLTLAGSLRPIDASNCRVSGRNSAFTRAVWQRAGGYPEWLYTAEDSLYRQRLREMGARVTYVPEAVVHWRPRPTLGKLARMIYLYARGNGRTGEPLAPHAYNLRNYALELGLLGSGFLTPWAWGALAALLAYFYATLHRPLVRRVQAVHPGWKAELYVPLISATRRLASTIGVLHGRWEFLRERAYRDNLAHYLGRPDAEGRPAS